MNMPFEDIAMLHATDRKLGTLSPHYTLMLGDITSVLSI
jgi:hypothetical protein